MKAHKLSVLGVVGILAVCGLLVYSNSIKYAQCEMPSPSEFKLDDSSPMYSDKYISFRYPKEFIVVTPEQRVLTQYPLGWPSGSGLYATILPNKENATKFNKIEIYIRRADRQFQIDETIFPINKLFKDPITGHTSAINAQSDVSKNGVTIYRQLYKYLDGLAVIVTEEDIYRGTPSVRYVFANQSSVFGLEKGHNVPNSRLESCRDLLYGLRDTLFEDIAKTFNLK